MLLSEPARRATDMIEGCDQADEREIFGAKVGMEGRLCARRLRHLGLGRVARPVAEP